MTYLQLSEEKAKWRTSTAVLSIQKSKFQRPIQLHNCKKKVRSALRQLFFPTIPLLVHRLFDTRFWVRPRGTEGFVIKAATAIVFSFWDVLSQCWASLRTRRHSPGLGPNSWTHGGISSAGQWIFAVSSGSSALPLRKSEELSHAQRKMIRNYSITNQHCKSYTHICIYSIYIYTELNILWPLLYLSTILSEKHIPWGWPPPSKQIDFKLMQIVSAWGVVVVGHFCHHFSVFTKAIFRGLVNFIIPDMMWVKQNSKTQKQFQQHRVVQNIFEIIWRYFLVSFAPGEGDKRSIRPHQMDLCPVAKGKNSPIV